MRLRVLCPALLLSVLLTACASQPDNSGYRAIRTPTPNQPQVTLQPAASPGPAEATDGNAPGIPELQAAIQSTPSGLQYMDQTVGNGDNPQRGQTVNVHYTGWLTNGQKFDSSVDRGQPFSFPLGQGSVIRGWDEGVATMKIGGKRRLIIPASLGYGANGTGPIPANATLIFDVELLSVQ